jgi:hypothetical protein
MKHLIFLLLTAFILAANAADKITVCNSVSSKGEPEGASSSFEFNTTTGKVTILTNLDKAIGFTKALIKIYRIENGKEIFDNNISVNTETSWGYFWSAVTIYKSNEFKVYVYRGHEEGNLIGTSSFKVALK